MAAGVECIVSSTHFRTQNDISGQIPLTMLQLAATAIQYLAFNSFPTHRPIINGKSEKADSL